jgi:hypothetical protein
MLKQNRNTVMAVDMEKSGEEAVTDQSFNVVRVGLSS